MPTKPRPEMPHLHIFLKPPGMMTQPAPWADYPMPDHSFSKEIFPNIQCKLPLMQLQAIASRPIAGYLGEETNTCLTATSFQPVV